MKANKIIARRYLLSRKHISLISTLTLISICGVTLGTALLIVVLSVFNGFFEVIQNLLLANDPDVRIESAEGREMYISQDQIEWIKNHDHVVSVLPYIQGKALIAHDRGADRVVMVRGVDAEIFREFSDMHQHIIRGGLNFAVESNTPGLIMGDRLANSLRVNTGDRLALLSAAGMQRALTQFAGPRGFNFEVRGMYSESQLMDESVVYMDIMAARRLFAQRATFSGIDIRLTDHDRAEAVKRSIEREMGAEVRASTWYDLQKPLYDVMNLEKWGAYFILMIIVIVAVLNIVGSLTMVVIQKTRDIGVLLSMGFKKKDIKKIFFQQGWYIGLIGCGLGGIIGLGLCWLQDTYGMVKLAGSESFIIEAYPVAVSGWDIALVLTGSLFMCLLASWYPASRASTVNPADAVRYE